MVNSLNRAKTIGFILSFFLFSGCVSVSKSSYHTGIEHIGGNRLAGVVSKSDGMESDAIVNRFRHAVNAGNYELAYDLFSSDLKGKLPFSKFEFAMQKLVNNYGDERAFYIIDAPITRRFPSLDEAIFADAFSYYDAVVSQYKSQRDKDVGYDFGLTRENGKLVICSFAYFIPEDEIIVEYDAMPHKGNKDSRKFVVTRDYGIE